MPLFLFCLGVVLLPFLFWLPEQAKYVLILIEIMWGSAYFFVVNRNYKEKKSLFTRGGTVDYNESPVRYKISYAIMYFLGAVVLFVSLLVTLFPKEA